MMSNELERVIGILCFKRWCFRMYKREDDKYIISVILGNEELESEVDDKKGLLALAFEIVDFHKEEYETCNINGELGRLFNICVDTKHEIEILHESAYYDKYDCSPAQESEWIVNIEIDERVYNIPYDNEKLIGAINYRLMPKEGEIITTYNGHNIYIDYILNVPMYAITYKDAYMMFDNIKDAKAFMNANYRYYEVK